MNTPGGRTAFTLLVFEVACQRYALPVNQVQEVLPLATLTPLPGAQAALAGILRLRGALLPVVDLRQRLGFPRIAPELGHRIVVARVAATPVGLLVDAVHDLLTIDEAEDATGGAPLDEVVRRVIETPSGVVALLGLEAVVGPELAASRAVTSIGPAAGQPALGAPRDGR